MSPLTTRLDAILADPLAEARARGGIGFVGLDVPQDLAFALPTACVHLPWHADRPTPFADAWLESGFPGWARSILETWSTGAFDALRTVIFSRGDDASQRLYYYVRELQRRGRLAGPEARVLDVARIPRASSLRHTRDALVELAASLEVDEPALRVGIERANRLRDGFASLAAARGRGGAQVHRLFRASLFADVTPLLADANATERVPSRLRVLLAGSAPPDERLHEAVERGGADIVAETHGYGPARLGASLDASAADAFGAVAEAMHRAPGPRSFAEPAKALEAAVAASRADAVVLWLTREDEALAWHVPALRSALESRGVPFIELTARRWDARDGALAEIPAFLEQQLR